MPEAYPAYSAPVSVPDRQWFEHAHGANSSYFPYNLAYEERARIFWKCPDDWAGPSRFRLIFRGGEAFRFQNILCTINVGTCDEAYNTHTENHLLDFTTAIGEYECVNLLTAFATVIALIDDCDVVEITLDSGDDGHYVEVIGLEVVEA